MNQSGYLGDEGEWHGYDEENSYSDWIIEYGMIQYNNMFDKEENQDLFHVS